MTTVQHPDRPPTWGNDYKAGVLNSAAMRLLWWLFTVHIIGFGAAMLHSPNRLVKPTWNQALAWAPPEVWGIGLVIFGLMCVIPILSVQRLGATFISGAYCAIGVAAFQMWHAHPDGSFLAWWGYFTWAAIWATLGATKRGAT